MTKNKKKSADVMDIVENFSEDVGRRINPKGPWFIKAIIMSISIILLSGVIVFFALFKKTGGKK
jgi:hypothetical protein